MIRCDEPLSSSNTFILATSEFNRDRAYKKQIAGYVVKDRVDKDLIDLLKLLGGHSNVVEFPPQEHVRNYDLADVGKRDCLT